MSIQGQKMIKFTMDMHPESHKILKLVCADQGVSMHKFVMQSIKERIEALEDEEDLQIAKEGMKDVEAGNVMDFDEFMKEIGL